MASTTQPMPTAASGSTRLMIPMALVAVYLIWGSTYLGLYLALESFPPFVLNAIRFTLAGGVIALGLALTRHEKLPSLRQALNAMLVGVLTLGVGVGAVAYAQQYVSSGLAALSVAAMPLWAAIFAAALYRRPSRMEWAGLLVGFSGIVLLNLDRSLSAQPQGAIPLLLGPVSWALGSILSRRLQMPNGFMAIALEMLGAAAFFWVLTLLTGQTVTGTPTLNAVLALLYLTTFGSLIGYTAFMYLMKHARPALATSYAYVNPVVALMLGVIFLGEARFITPVVVVASVITLGGVVLVGYASAQGKVGASHGSPLPPTKHQQP